MMRNLFLLTAYRNHSDEKRIYGCAGDEGNGIFNVKSPIDGVTMIIIASNGEGWDHVSVSRRNRCPNWAEMEHVKRLFFEDDETACQFHVPPSDHVNFHENCLHLWRPQTTELPRPPAYMVAPKEAA